MHLKTKITLVSTIAVLTATLTLAQAQDPGDQRIPFDVRKTGIVNVIKDKNGDVSNIRLVVTSYEIALDENSKALENMDGYKVRIVASYSIDEAGKNWLTVKNIETIAAAQPELTAEPEASATDAAAPAVAPATPEAAAPEAAKTEPDQAAPAAAPEAAAEPAAAEAQPAE